jgi:hypothetical protein
MSLAPTNEESARVNEEKNHIGKIVSHLSACDVSRVVSLVTDNLKRKSFMRVENSCVNLDFYYLLII